MIKNLIIFIYLCLAGLHIFIVKNALLLVALVLIFEAVRLIAILAKEKLVMAFAGVISSVFLLVSYYSFSLANTFKNNQNEGLAKNIIKYTGKYWTSQGKFQQFITSHQTLIKSINILPNFYIIAVLVLFIEFSLAYILVVKNAKRDLTL